MGEVARTPQWGRGLRYSVGGFLLTSLPMAIAGKTAWPTALVLSLGGAMLILGGRRIFRAAVARTAPETLVCQFAPWFESYAYMQVLIPLMASAAAVQGFTTGPRWFGYSGIAVLLITSLLPIGLVIARRRCFLRLTPEELSVRAAGPVRTIRRADVERIEAVVGAQRLDPRQIRIISASGDSGEPVITMLPGLQLTVEPDNLLHALQAWTDPHPHEAPDGLMDRIEATLRGRPGGGNEHGHWSVRR